MLITKVVLKRIIPAISAYLFNRIFLERKKTTPRRHKQKVVLKTNNFFDNHHPDGRGCREKCLRTSLFIYKTIHEFIPVTRCEISFLICFVVINFDFKLSLNHLCSNVHGNT